MGQKEITTIRMPSDLRKKGKKYMVDLGMNFSAWVCDRLHREMEEYYKLK